MGPRMLAQTTSVAPIVSQETTKAQTTSVGPIVSQEFAKAQPTSVAPIVLQATIPLPNVPTALTEIPTVVVATLKPDDINSGVGASAVRLDEIRTTRHTAENVSREKWSATAANVSIARGQHIAEAIQNSAVPRDLLGARVANIFRPSMYPKMIQLQPEALHG